MAYKVADTSLHQQFDQTSIFLMRIGKHWEVIGKAWLVKTTGTKTESCWMSDEAKLIMS